MDINLLLKYPLKSLIKLKKHLLWQFEGMKKLKKDKVVYSKLNKRNEYNITKKDMYPIVTDYFKQAGALGYYFYQDLWAAKKYIKITLKFIMV